MRAAIVDDELQERQRLQEFIHQFSMEETAVETELFSSGDAFLDHLKSSPDRYDIVLFDIDMPGTNGLETARRLRADNSRITILFVTNIASYAINGYEVDAVDYILKPVSYHDFSVKFRKAVRRAQRLAVQEVVLETAEGVRKVPVARVTYIEVLGHYVIWHLVIRNTDNSDWKGIKGISQGRPGITGQAGSRSRPDVRSGGSGSGSVNSPKESWEETIRVRGTISATAGMLDHFSFCQVHKSYLVNLAYVENIGTNEVTVAGEAIPVGRKYHETLMQEFMKYLRG